MCAAFNKRQNADFPASRFSFYDRFVLSTRLPAVWELLHVSRNRRPWIAPLERSRCAASLSLPLTAMIEAIGDDPALVDTTGDPDAMTSALLPAVGSR